MAHQGSGVGRQRGHLFASIQIVELQCDQPHRQAALPSCRADTSGATGTYGKPARPRLLWATFQCIHLQICSGVQLVAGVHQQSQAVRCTQRGPFGSLFAVCKAARGLEGVPLRRPSGLNAAALLVHLCINCCEPVHDHAAHRDEARCLHPRSSRASCTWTVRKSLLLLWALSVPTCRKLPVSYGCQEPVESAVGHSDVHGSLQSMNASWHWTPRRFVRRHCDERVLRTCVLVSCTHVPDCTAATL